VTDQTFSFRLREAMRAKSRRGLLLATSGSLVAAIGAASSWPAEQVALSRGNTLGNERKKRKRHKSVCRHLRIAGGATKCGDQCCARSTHVCCADPTDPSGKSCFPIGAEC